MIIQSIGSKVEGSVSRAEGGTDAAGRPLVFARFGQKHSSSTRAVARGLAGLHGGSIQTEGSRLGHESTFTVKFPRSPVTIAASNERA